MTNVNSNALPNYTQPLLTGANISSVWYKFFSALPLVAGTYNQTFASGQLQYSGPNGTLAGSNNFIVGTKIPTPATPFPGAAAMLLGSGGGNGTPISFWIVQDAPFDDVTPGNNLGISAGESDGAQAGGQLFMIGGGSASGLGGTLQAQGGTSVSGNGGPAVLQGGNSTSGIPGDAFVSGGQAGTQGANVHLIMTTVNGISGVCRIRNNSDPLIDFYPDGSVYLYKGGGFGTAGQQITSQGAGQPVKWA